MVSNTLEMERLEQANELIKVIASCGRRFFQNDGFVSYFELSKSKRVFFIDYFTKQRIYTHRKYVAWRGFTSGGTLKALIESLRDFIKKGTPLNVNYFNSVTSIGSAHPWGYGDDLSIVKQAAEKLGIAR